MTSLEATVLTAWGKTCSWWGLQALGARRFSRSCSVLRSLTVQTPRFLVLQWGESAAAERGGADRHYTALQAQSYLYSVYRFTLTHHGAGRSIKIAAAYHWKKKKEICLYFVSVISTNKKQINHLHMTVGCVTDTRLFAYWLHTLLTFFVFLLIPFFSKCPHKMPIRCRHGLIFIQCISLITMQNKSEITSFHQSHKRINLIVGSSLHIVLSCLLPCSQWDETIQPYHTVEGCFIVSE